MSNQNKRKENLKKIYEIVKYSDEIGLSVDKEKLICEMSLKYGLSRRTLLEYIKTLVLGEKIICLYDTHTRREYLILKKNELNAKEPETEL